MNMKVTVSVNGRFHAFDLAGELYRQGNLHLLITTYPYSKVSEWGIPKQRVISLLPLEVFNRAIRYFPSIFRNWLSLKQVELYDYIASKFIPPETDIFVGWSASSRECIRKANRLGIKTIVERGSSHIEYQNRILKEEYALQGKDYGGHHPNITKRELVEYRESDYISIPSNFVERTFLEKGFSRKKLLHNPYGVDLGKFKKVAKEDDVFRIVFAGGLIIRKGVQYLLQAFFELNLENSELWLVGTASDEIKEYLQKYDNGRVKLVGHQPQDSLYWYYSQCDVFCHPSLEEGLSMVQPQAMACALPLICTTNSGGDDLVEDGKEGFVVPIRDVESLKEKIRYLHDNPEIREAMAHNASMKVKEGYSWRDYGDRMEALYKTVLD
ncbi:MAG: glycosyltransferase family 4 protein [Sedimenticola sp.]